MALTRNDLQQIKNIVDESLDGRITPLEIDVKGLKTDVGVLKTDVSGLKVDVGVLKTDNSSLKIDVKDIKKSIRKIEKNSKIIVDYFDREDIRTSKRIEKIEKHLGLPQN